MDAQDTRFSGWVLLGDGKITAMGEGEPPVCAEALDGEGGVLTPGLIDIHSHLGLYEDGLGFEGADGNEDTDPVTPHLRAIDGVNPMDRGFQFMGTASFLLSSSIHDAGWEINGITTPCWAGMLVLHPHPERPPGH